MPAPVKVLYALSHLTDWVAIAGELQSRLAWSPQYWICTDVTESLIKERFPECDTQHYLSIIRGESPTGKKLFTPAGIDEVTLKAYALEMDLAMKMMDRMDAGDGFSYNERKFFFLRLLNYAHNVLRLYNPEFAVFTEIPHHASQYVLYQVLKKNGVKTLMFKPNTTIDVRLLIYNDIYDDPIETLRDFDFQEVLNNEEERKVSQFVTSKRGDYSKGIPSTIKSLQREDSQSKAILKTVFRLMRKPQLRMLFDRSRYASIRKMKGVRLEDSVMNKAQRYWYKWKGFNAQRKLRKSLDNYISHDVDLDSKFVYVPLHYQPERTTSPDGGVYVEQIILIQLLREVLPGDIDIYVKEHKSQYLTQRDGHLSRFSYQYHGIDEMNGVKLVPMETDPFELLDRSWFVATVVGTTGLEAVARGKVAMVFGGGCWFRSLKGVFYIQNRNQLVKALAQIENEITLDPEEVERFMKNFYKKSFEGVILPTFRYLKSPEENVKVMSEAIERYVEHVY